MKIKQYHLLTIITLILLSCSIAIDSYNRKAIANLNQVADVNVQYEDINDWHLVKQGESLISITRNYLGSSQRWREIWKLNTDLKNPNIIFVGQRIKVIKQRKVVPEPVVAKSEIIAHDASINIVVNNVDKNVKRDGWTSAGAGDRLAAADGVRTLAVSSAELQFEDESRVILTEYSQLYLRGNDSEHMNITRNTVEIEKGSADLLLSSGQPQTGELEILIGDARSVAMRGTDGTAKTRSRRGQDSRSQIMVYAGLAQVEANGITIEVPNGMGTTVKDGSPPNAPERLLPQPTLTLPVNNAQIAKDSPLFNWNEVEGSAYYEMEICKDVDCGALVRKNKNITTTSYQVEKLTPGKLYWRVTAVSESGLQGFPSIATEFEIVKQSMFKKYRTIIITGIIVLLLLLTIWLIRRNRTSNAN